MVSRTLASTGGVVRLIQINRDVVAEVVYDVGGEGRESDMRIESSDVEEELDVDIYDAGKATHDRNSCRQTERRRPRLTVGRTAPISAPRSAGL